MKTALLSLFLLSSLPFTQKISDGDAKKNEVKKASAGHVIRFAQNKVIAHRGAWKTKNLPENSIASLREAVRLGCYGSEFDVHMTSDSVIVVNHDPEFKGLKIETSTYKELLEKKHDNGESIPTLEAYIKEGKTQKTTRLILELKASVIDSQRTIALTGRAVKMVHDLKAEKWIEYISFDDNALRKVKELDPKAKVQSLLGKLSPRELKDAGFSGADYHFSVYRKQPDFMNASHKLGLVINAWTVNSEVDITDMLKAGADYITTNEPERVFSILAKKQE
ncbi:MAG: glycerophosphodiester phosphodiesterase [Mucilaginibacter polytrichastri]|nr:glycerophosphodiester phosphodiesterase [Mucilaginibacter polytrichastri]